MAWLNATPKPHPRSKRAQVADAAPTVSRIDQMKADGIKPPMPPAALPHIVDRLVEIGLSESASMGAAPLNWSTIAAWVTLTGVEILPWEARLIRRLSIAYLAEGRRAESESCPAPWRTEVSPRDAEVEEAKLRMVFG